MITNSHLLCLWSYELFLSGRLSFDGRGLTAILHLLCVKLRQVALVPFIIIQIYAEFVHVASIYVYGQSAIITS